MTMHPSNWTETGGTIGRTRTLPGFEIIRQPNGYFCVKDETTGRMCGWGFDSPCKAIKQYHAQAQRRVTTYTEELTPAGPQLVIPGCEARDRPRTAQLSLWP